MSIGTQNDTEYNDFASDLVLFQEILKICDNFSFEVEKLAESIISAALTVGGVIVGAVIGGRQGANTGIDN